MPSLINIFQRVLIQADKGLPGEALSPMSWAVFTLWQHQESERDTEFTQFIDVVMPNGQTFVSTEVPFKVTAPEDLQTKNVVNIFGLPAANEGVFHVRVRLAESEVLGDYPFFVKHVNKRVDEESSSTSVG